MSEEIKPENMRIHSRADELIACLEGEIAKRDEELAACRVAVENCEVFRARIAELEAKTRTAMGVGSGSGNLFVYGNYDSIKAAQKIVIERDQLRAELAAIKAQEPVARLPACPSRAFAVANLRDLAQSVMQHDPDVGMFCDEDQAYLINELADLAEAFNGDVKLYAAPVSEAKAQGVVQWPNADEIMQMAFEEGQPADDASGYYFELEEFDLFIERLMSEVARLNAAPAQQVSVPDGWRELAKRADDFLYSLPETDGVLRLRADLCTMLSAPAATAADAGMVEARKANNELVNDLHVMTNKRRQLVDALTYLRECLDPDDYMGEISMHDFIDDALAAHRSTGVV